jgi:hypothetical protein
MLKKMVTVMMVTVVAVFVMVSAPSARAEDQVGNEKKSETKCHLDYALKGWSAFYKTSKGEGTIGCDNGQQASVDIDVHGGGITFGKTKITNGRGTFSSVHDISELYGAYATSEAHAGVVESAQAQAMTKGPVSLALHGTGKGVDLGIAFGQFKITQKK